MADQREQIAGPECIRVLIVDRLATTRIRLREILEGEPDIAIVGEATSGREALEQVAELKPDLVLLALLLSELNGIGTTRLIKQTRPSTNILIVAGSEHAHAVLEALAAGASGYVLTEATAQELLTALRQVNRGSSFLTPQLASQLLRQLTKIGAHGAQSSTQLSPQERKLVSLAAQGYDDKQIARMLNLAATQVEQDFTELIARFEQSNRRELIAYLRGHGLINPQD